MSGGFFIIDTVSPHHPVLDKRGSQGVGADRLVPMEYKHARSRRAEILFTTGWPRDRLVVVTEDEGWAHWQSARARAALADGGADT